MEKAIVKSKNKVGLCAKIIKKYKKRIIVWTFFCTVLGAFIVYILSFYIKDKYEAKATCYCVYENGTNDKNTFDYSSLARSNSVCQKALAKDKELSHHISVSDLQKNVFTSMDDKVGELCIDVTLDNKEDAMVVANLVAHCFCDEVKDLTKKDIYKVMDKDVCVNRTQNSKLRLALVFLLIVVVGFVINILLVCKKALASKKILLASECSLDGELDIIGILPDFNKIK